MPDTKESRNKALVLKAFDALFNRRDYAEAERIITPGHIQHSASSVRSRGDCSISSKGYRRHQLCGAGRTVAEDGDFVIVHGRFSASASRSIGSLHIPPNRVTGFSRSIGMIQDEATREQSKSGLPMFGESFRVGAFYRKAMLL